MSTVGRRGIEPSCEDDTIIKLFKLNNFCRQKLDVMALRPLRACARGPGSAGKKKDRENRQRAPANGGPSSVRVAAGVVGRAAAGLELAPADAPAQRDGGIVQPAEAAALARRVATRFTFAMHNMDSPRFFACAHDRWGSTAGCLDPELWLVHLKGCFPQD